MESRAHSGVGFRVPDAEMESFSYFLALIFLPILHRLPFGYSDVKPLLRPHGPPFLRALIHAFIHAFIHFPFPKCTASPMSSPRQKEHLQKYGSWMQRTHCLKGKVHTGADHYQAECQGPQDACAPCRLGRDRVDVRIALSCCRRRQSEEEGTLQRQRVQRPRGKTRGLLE